jgi:hypothetical protein
MRRVDEMPVGVDVGCNYDDIIFEHIWISTSVGIEWNLFFFIGSRKLLTESNRERMQKRK